MLKKLGLSSLNWDAKTVLAVVFFFGYFALIILAMNIEMTPEQAVIVKELVGPLLPIVGIVAFAIWKNSRKSNLEAAANAEANVMHAESAQKTATALETLAAKTDPPPDRDPWDSKS